MIDIIIVLAGGYLTFVAYKMSILTGLILSLLVLGIILYRKASAICMAIAMRLYTKGKKIKAMDWFERAYKAGMKTDQKTTYAYYLLREGRTGRCEEILSGMLAFNSQKPQEKIKAKSSHALLLMKTGRLYEAQEELEEIFPNSKNTSTYGSLGFCYLVQGNLQKAFEFNKEAYDFNSDDAVIIDNMMQTYAKMGNFNEAYEVSQKLMEKNPLFREAYYDTAVVEYQMGKNEDAIKRLEHALTIPTSFLTTVSDEVINTLKSRIEAGKAPTGSDMVFLESTSASLPDTPTLRTRPQTVIRRTVDGTVESDDPISFNTKSEMTEETAKASAEPEVDEDDDGDGVFL